MRDDTKNGCVADYTNPRFGPSCRSYTIGSLGFTKWTAAPQVGRFNSTLVSEQAFSKGPVMSFHNDLVLVNLLAPSTNVVFPFLC